MVGEEVGCVCGGLIGEGEWGRFGGMKLVVRLLLYGLCVGLLSGCVRKVETEADAAVRAQVLLVGNGDEPRTLDPHLATGTIENKVITALMEGLTAYHERVDMTAMPGVAERWEANEDNTRWTFYLRETARWSNGDPVTAHDFLYAWKRILTAALGAEYAEQLYYLKGAEAYHSGKVADFAEVGCRAIDAHTLELELVGPVPYLPLVLTHYSWFPVHPPTIEKFGGPALRSSEWTKAGNFVGNGAFVLTQWEVNEIIKVEANPHYWDAGVVRLKGIHFLPIQQGGVEETAFEAGRVHMTNTVLSDKIDYWRTRQPEALRMEPFLGTYYYSLNLRRKPLDDVRVRQALSLAIDRELITGQVTKGGQTPATGFTPPGLTYPVLDVIRYDPDRARALLAEAGFAGGKGFSNLTILYNTLEDHRKIAETIQQMWKRELGISVNLMNQEWGVYLNSQNQRNFDIARAGWIGDYPDPMAFVGLWTSTNGNNRTGWGNERYDALVDEAKRTGDEARRMLLLREAEQIFLQELPTIPLYFYSRNYLLDPRVQNWHPKALDNRPWKAIWLRE